MTKDEQIREAALREITARQDELQALARESSVIFLAPRNIAVIHDLLIERYGGLHGVRDPGLLESAAARPVQQVAYSDVADLGHLAAVLGAGIIRNHAFLDGNKRTGYLGMLVLLAINQASLQMSPIEHMVLVQDLAAGRISEESFVTAFTGRVRGIQ